MNLLLFIKAFQRLNKYLGRIMKKPIKINRVSFPVNPRNPNWGYRPTGHIEKIIVHQELGEGNVLAVHNYHISRESHLKLGIGAPAFAYHYGIEKDGTILHVNDHTAVTWHTKGQNLHGLGIMLVGNFAGPGNVNGKAPTQEQLNSLRKLLNHLVADLDLTKQDVYGHQDFGKPVCPGFVVYDFITDYKKERFRIT